MFDPMKNINQMMADSNRLLNHSQKQMADARAQEVERQERNNELLEINVNQNTEMIKLQNMEVGFLESISGDAAKLVDLLKSLEVINQTNGTITEANMLLIQQRLDEIIENTEPANINQLFMDEVKNQILEKGVGFGIQFFITGLKLLLI